MPTGESAATRMIKAGLGSARIRLGAEEAEDFSLDFIRLHPILCFDARLKDYRGGSQPRSRQMGRTPLQVGLDLSLQH